jgi:poly-gamma-glutamate capsule biosynthesis protein CapA/YwtB (metallophosphatase superfamily)
VELVRKLDSLADIVIVSAHIGAEGKKHQHITKQTEYFLGHNRGNPYEFARLVIDAGADVFFGHGPHVTRAVDVYKDRFIAYSLGNFATYKRFNLSGPNGVAPIIKVFVDKEGKFVYAKVFPVYQTKQHGPKPDPENRALDIIRTLTASDLPELKITITGQGIIMIDTENR